jgi:hypothetical protein
VRQQVADGRLPGRRAQPRQAAAGSLEDPWFPEGRQDARRRLAGIQAALLSHRAGPCWLAAAQAQAPGRPLLQHPVALASSCDHAGRDGLRHCLIGRLAGLPGHP